MHDVCDTRLNLLLDGILYCHVCCRHVEDGEKKRGFSFDLQVTAGNGLMNFI